MVVWINRLFLRETSIIMKIKYLIYLSFITLFFLSCSSKPSFSDGKVFEDSSWNRFDILEYEFPIENISHNYDIMLKITVNNEYIYDYLRTNITLFYPDGGMRSRDYEFKLKDQELKWIGDEINRKITFELPINKGLSFSQKGNYRIRIENKIPKFSLAGIEMIYVKLYKSK